MTRSADGLPLAKPLQDDELVIPAQYAKGIEVDDGSNVVTFLPGDWAEDFEPWLDLGNAG